MRLNETGNLSTHSCCESGAHFCSQPCLCLCTGERGDRSRVGGSRQARGGQSIPVRQGQGRRGEKAPGKAWGKPGALTMAQPTCAWPPPHPAPNWGCRGLQLPARSHLTALAKLGRAAPITPFPSPDPAGCPTLGVLFGG